MGQLVYTIMGMEVYARKANEKEKGKPFVLIVFSAV